MQNGTHEQTDVIVIGGGLAGLAAAAYVARGGRSVTLLERSTHVGGRGITNDLDGFRFNLGPHAVYRKGPAAKVLRELGVELHGGVPPTSGYALRDEALHYTSQSPRWFMTTKLLTGRAKIDLVRYFMRLPRMKAERFARTPVRDWLAHEARQPGSRALVEGLTRVATYANDPELSAGVAVKQLQLALRGVLYLDGGWQTLVDGLRSAAERAGARIETGAAVERVEHDSAVRGVRLKDGRLLEATAVIIAAAPRAAAELIESATLRRIADAAVPVRAACLDIGLRRLPHPDRGFAFGLDQPLYFSVHSRVAKLAPEGCAAIHVAKYLAPQDTDAAASERELESFVDLVQPGWRDELAARRYLPNLNVIEATARATDGGIAARPGVDAAGIESVYIAGDWVGAEGWLSDAALASAKRAAELVLAGSAATRPTARAVSAGVA